MSARDRIPVEYFMLRPAAQGPIIGTIASQPIPETVVDDCGNRYRYRGLAPRRPDGRPDVERLGEGEWILAPGLLYRAEPTGR